MTRTMYSQRIGITGRIGIQKNGSLKKNNSEGSIRKRQRLRSCWACLTGQGIVPRATGGFWDRGLIGSWWYKEAGEALDWGLREFQRIFYPGMGGKRRFYFSWGAWAFLTDQGEEADSVRGQASEVVQLMVVKRVEFERPAWRDATLRRWPMWGTKKVMGQGTPQDLIYIL